MALVPMSARTSHPIILRIQIHISKLIQTIEMHTNNLATEQRQIHIKRVVQSVGIHIKALHAEAIHTNGIIHRTPAIIHTCGAMHLHPRKTVKITFSLLANMKLQISKPISLQVHQAQRPTVQSTLVHKLLIYKVSRGNLRQRQSIHIQTI